MNYYNGIIYITNRFSEFMIYEAMNAAIQTAWKDSRIGKIVRGAGLFTVGSLLISASGVFKMKPKFWTNIAPSNQEPLLTKALRYGMSAIGLIAICYGIYNIALGTLGLAAFNITEELSSSLVQSNLVNQLPENSCQEHIDHAKQTLLSCPEAKDLWENLERENPFSIRCAQDSEAIFGAKLYLKNREIVIANDTEMGNSLLFELHNLQQLKKINVLQENMCKLTPDNYAVNVEEVEYLTRIRTQSIAKKCFSRGLWSEEFAFPPGIVDVPLNFNEYVATQELGHTDMIRLDWYKFCNSAQIHEKCLAMDMKYSKILKDLKIAQEQLETLPSGMEKLKILKPLKIMQEQLSRVRLILNQTLIKHPSN